MGEEPLLQKLKIQEDLESDKRILVNDGNGDGDGPATLVLLLTTLTALWGVFSYGTAVISPSSLSVFFSRMLPSA